MKYHPLLLVYKDTLKKSFPLILVVGREPNNTGEIGAELGEYDWAKNPSTRSCFWAVAHEALAHALDKKPYEVKNICRENYSSPIIITNAGTKCVLDASGQQVKMRMSSLQEERKQHISNLENLLKKYDIFQRIKWVWLCGIEKDFPDFRPQLLKIFKYQQIHHFNIPYLSRRQPHNKNYKEYIKSCQKLQDEAKSVFKQFIENINNQACSIA